MKITIDESKWGPKFLLSADTGKQCCVGQAAEQCGADPDQMRGRTMMSADALRLDPRMGLSVSDMIATAVGNLTGYVSNNGKWQLKNALAYLNDAYHRATDKALRKDIKAAIVAGFADAGYELEFVK